jgi:hypothetical protein
MTKICRFHRLGLALGLMFALSAQTASAGTLEIDLTVGATVINILKGGIYDVADPLDLNTITVNTNQLNADLLAAGHGNLTFTDLGVNSNNPGDPTGATLIQTGTALVSSGTVTFSLVAFQTDYFIPSGSNATMESSAGGTFTKTSTGNQTLFTSYFSGDNSGTVATGTPSPTLSFLAPNTNGNAGYGDTAAITPLGSIAGPYGVVNQINVTLTGSTGKVGKDQFTGSTVIFATAIPEPASAVMMMSAFPIAFGLIRRYRRFKITS